MMNVKNLKDGEFIIRPDFQFGDKVMLAADHDWVGVVIDYRLQPGNIIKYGVSWPGNYDFHYEFELLPADFNEKE